MNEVIRLVQAQRINGFGYCVMELKLLEATDQICILRLQLSIGLTASLFLIIDFAQYCKSMSKIDSKKPQH